MSDLKTGLGEAVGAAFAEAGLPAELGRVSASDRPDLAESVVAELVSYSPREALPEIRDAFRLGLVDSIVVGMDDVDRSIAEGQAGFRKELEWCRSTGVRDTVAELSGWAAFRDEDESGRAFRQPPVSATTPADDWDTDLEDEGPRPSDMTIRNTAPKVGRNEPCPCGSGKKYKKCCGAG